MDAEFLKTQSVVSAVFSQFANPKQLKAMYHEVSNKVIVARKLKEYHEADLDNAPKGIDSSIRIYNALVSAGIIQNSS